VNHLQGAHRRHPQDTQVVQVTLLVTRPGGSPEEVELDIVSDDLRVKGDTLGTAAAVNSLSAWLPVGATGAAAAASASNSSSSSASSTTATAAAATGLHSSVLLSCSAAGLQPLHAYEDAAQGLLRQGIAPLAQQLSGAAQLPQKRLKAAQQKWGLQHAESWTVKQAAAVAAAGGSADGRDVEASLQQFLAAALCTGYTTGTTAHELVAGAALRQQGVRLVGGALRSAMLSEEPNDLDLHLSSDCPAAASSGGDHVAAAEAVLTAICADLGAMGLQCCVQREGGEQQLTSDCGKSGGSSTSSSKSSSTSSSKSSSTSSTSSTSPAAVAPMLRVYWDMNGGAATSTADQVSTRTHADYL
jgi:hypothetical protein